MTWTTKRHNSRDIQTPMGVNNIQGSGGSKAKAETRPQYNAPDNREAIRNLQERRARAKRSTIKKVQDAIPTCPTWAVATAAIIITLSFMITGVGAQQWKRTNNDGVYTRQQERRKLEPEVADSTGKVTFATIGHTSAARKYYQWSYTYDIEGLRDNITGLTEAMHHWADGVGAPPFKRYNTSQWLGDEHHDAATDLQIAMFHQLNRIGRTLDRFTDITKTVEELTEEYYEVEPNKRFEVNTRHKRFAIVPIVKTVLAVTMTAYYGVSLYNELSGNQVAAQIQVIKEAARNSAFLHELEASNLSTLAALVKEIADDLDVHKYYAHAHIKIRTVLDELEQYVKNILSDFEAAKDGACPINMFTNQHLGELLHDIKKATSEGDWEPLVTRGTDLTQIDCTFTTSKQEFNIIARLPLVNAATTTEIMRLVPFPILMESGKLLFPTAGDKTHLLISKDGEHFAERTTADISECKRRGNLFSCNRNNVLRKIRDDSTQHSCLLALYTNKFEDAAKTCQFEVRQPLPLLEQINYNTFLAYTPEPQKATFYCKGYNYVATLHDVDLITLTDGCSIKTEDFFVVQDEIIHQASADVLPVQQVDWPKALEFLSDEFSEAERELLGEVQRNHKNARNSIFRHEVKQTIEQIQEDSDRIKAEANANKERLDNMASPTGSKWTKWALVGGIIAVGIIAILAFILYCTLQATKVSIKDLPNIIIQEGARHFGLPMQQPPARRPAPPRPTLAREVTNIVELSPETAIVPVMRSPPGVIMQQ